MILDKERFILVEYSNSKFSIYKIDDTSYYQKIHPKSKDYYKLFIQLLIDRKRKILK